MRFVLRSLLLVSLVGWFGCAEDIRFAPDDPGCPTADSQLPTKGEPVVSEPPSNVSALSLTADMWNSQATCFGQYQITSQWGGPELNYCGGTFTTACRNRAVSAVAFTVTNPTPQQNSYCFFEADGDANGWTSTTSLLVYRDDPDHPFELQQVVAQDGSDHVKLLTNGISFTQRTGDGTLHAMLRFDGIKAQLTTSLHVWCAPRAVAAAYAESTFRQLLR